MATFRRFGLPLRHRPHLPPVDPVAVTRTLVESAQLATDALLTRLESTTEGLTNHEAAQRYQTSGPNSIADSEHNGL